MKAKLDTNVPLVMVNVCTGTPIPAFIFLHEKTYIPVYLPPDNIQEAIRNYLKNYRRRPKKESPSS